MPFQHEPLSWIPAPTDGEPSNRSPLLVTLGDPNGLGPELVVRLFLATRPVGPILLIGPESALLGHTARLGATPFWTRIERFEDLPRPARGVFLFSPPELDGFVLRLGQAQPEGGRAAGLSLAAACDLCVRGLSPGIVTLPLNKAMLQEAGFDFPGHTEFLAHAAGLSPGDVCMHLCGEVLRVSLATTHPPLRLVPDLITGPRILRCLQLTEGLIRVLDGNHALLRPIAVCGLNPHAGEGGKIGREEIEIIAPAVEEARALGVSVAGPLPADTVFYRAAQGEFAAVLAMYHDQGLGPLKLLHFHRAVNVTLGLPFARTSVDHGTGYDLAGKDTADCGSLAAALALARKLVAVRG